MFKGTIQIPIEKERAMTEVQAIKDMDITKSISHLLGIRHSKQMSDVWKVGINLAFRIFDLLTIKYNDIKEDRWERVEADD
jgi:hypothetical protein